MKTLSVQLSTAYPIYIGNAFLVDQLKEYCAGLNKRLAIITDSNLIALGEKLKSSLSAELFSFPAGEQHKTRETKQLLEDKLLLKKYGRDTCLIALGGGVALDLVGFLAATYCRGVPVIYIPTTLLAMVDASIGGKTGVNTPHGKNLIGTFTQPQAVFIDTDTLNTLPTSEWRNGIAEMIKHGLIADPQLFATLEKNYNHLQKSDFLIDLIEANCLIKKNIIEQDEREQGARKLLNFGHTIGHAIETLEHYHISHGEAIAIGMLVESHLSFQAGYLSDSFLIQLRNILQNYGFPLYTSVFGNQSLFQKTLMLDKKSINTIPRFVLLEKIGKPSPQYTAPINSEHLDSAFKWAKTLC